MRRKHLIMLMAAIVSMVFNPYLHAHAQTYYVADNGDDTLGDGTSSNPWATITNALDHVPDGSTILVRAGTYYGRTRLRGTFTQGVTVRSETPFKPG